LPINWIIAFFKANSVDVRFRLKGLPRKIKVLVSSLNKKKETLLFYKIILWKPLNVIVLGQTETDTIIQMITDNFKK
jgi:hypothetical protein